MKDELDKVPAKTSERIPLGSSRDEEDIDDVEKSDGIQTFQSKRKNRTFLVYCLLGVVFLFSSLVYFIIRKHLTTNFHAFLKDDLPNDVVTLMEKNISACDDFYLYSCGQWLKNTEIPSEKSSVSVTFSTISDKNEEILQDVIDENWPLIGEFYQSCMNVTLLNETGAKPLKETLDKISKVQTKKELFYLAGEISIIGPNFLTAIYIYADSKDATRNVIYAGQDGLSLPDPQYYLDPKKWTTYQNDFKEFITKIFVLAEWNQTEAEYRTQVVLDFEKRLASIYVPKEELKDPIKTYNPMSIKDASKKYPYLLGDFIEGAGIAKILQNKSNSLVLKTPSFFEKVEKLVAETSVSSLQILLEYQYIRTVSTILSEPFVDASFQFFNKKLSGQKQRSPRWKVCVGRVKKYFQNLMGKYFFLKKFDGKSEETAQEMVEAIESAMKSRLEKSAVWLDDSTRNHALNKLEMVSNLIGHSHKKESFPFVLKKDDLFENIQTLMRYHYNQAIKKLGKEVDRSEWHMNAADVNAYYSPSANQMVFPAGILQPPFFDAKRHPAQNFGSIGTVIGHELTHGFDNQGRYYDGKGNVSPWWSNHTEEEFKKKSQCLVKQYGSFIVKSVTSLKPLGHVNGNYTLGENIADNGGLKLSFDAYRDYMKSHSLPSANFHERLFFISFAQAFCRKSTYAALEVILLLFTIFFCNITTYCFEFSGV
jgi:predicted metalloendopeptidase